MNEKELRIVTGSFIGHRCSGLRITRAPKRVLLGVNGSPEFAVPLTGDDAITAGLKLIELGHQLLKEGIK